MTAYPGPAVVRAGEADIDVLSQVIADAFYYLAVSQWLIPDPDARREIFPGYFRLYLEHAITVGIVHTTADRTAAALWIPVGQQGPPAAPGSHGPRLATATGRWLSRFAAFDATLDRHHPVGVAHEHLAILAVRPDRQRLGIGTAMMNARHASLDRDGTPAYLEASDLVKRDIYRSHGYVLRPDAPIRLPEGGPHMYPMWRLPHAGPETAGWRM